METTDTLTTTPPIAIPEGKLAAPDDHKWVEKAVVIDGRVYGLRLIKQISVPKEHQTTELLGNCAEYAALNAAQIMMVAGFDVNKDIQKLITDSIAQNRKLNLDRIEVSHIIPLLTQAQKRINGVVIGEEDKANLIEKTDNPYEPLTIVNSVLLFRYALSNAPKDFTLNDIVKEQNLDAHFAERKVGVFMVGQPNHAVALVANGHEHFIVDTYSDYIVAPVTAGIAKAYLRQSLAARSFITFNESEKF